MVPPPSAIHSSPTLSRSLRKLCQLTQQAGRTALLTRPQPPPTPLKGAAQGPGCRHRPTPLGPGPTRTPVPREEGQERRHSQEVWESPEDWEVLTPQGSLPAPPGGHCTPKLERKADSRKQAKGSAESSSTSVRYSDTYIRIIRTMYRQSQSTGYLANG